ncbi:hypothetical protein K437DRAFT_273611 [Tilletiaria anomala UBC 951]|uniref:MINDY deubiquitinase domain-containing protein n=1 Tax=Tilletiaria anomala (strain ATCC 24038 / CBS 436.72 / UBC 951) TaxID=1037660 RepID=A0A066WAF6_TILAU|nr:uncharacterized protein K437DRAFT_273611 [Tilletiaria anomala UBC 951]KDN47755.1 hypothetical protein K437DRAFT_273611 [Tilletiaria anomala UBC 951]
MAFQHNPFLSSRGEAASTTNTTTTNPFQSSSGMASAAPIGDGSRAGSYHSGFVESPSSGHAAPAHNPFRVAQSHHQPYVDSNGALPPPSSPSTNPFRNNGIATPVEQQGFSAPPPLTGGTKATMAASGSGTVHHISDDLAGLDFSGASSSSALQTQAPVAAPPSGPSSGEGSAYPDRRILGYDVQNGYYDGAAAASSSHAVAVGGSSSAVGADMLDPASAAAVSAAVSAADADSARQIQSQTAGDEALARRIAEQQKVERKLGHGRQARAVVAGTNGVAPEEEALWNTKDVYWRGIERKIITQNENGPCSLIALCNVLLLRGDLVITPADRPAVSYSYLSSMLAEYLLTRPQPQGEDGVDLSAALSILPRTQYGLDVNVRFDAVDSFTPASSLTPAASASASSAHAAEAVGAGAAATGELALFKLCGVKLVHGWLPDPADAETYRAVTACGDYDKALDKVVEGDELAKGLVVESHSHTHSGGGGGGNGGRAAGALGSHLDRLQKGKGVQRAGSDDWSDEHASTVKDALLIRDFLSSTSTQLSYHGLFVLAHTLQQGEAVALFRNSHLSVLYRRLPHEGMEEEERPQAMGDLNSGSTSDAAQPNGHGSSSAASEIPQLFTLATDSAFLMEDEVVWESLADVDQAASEFFDGKFRKTRIEGDWVGVDSRGRRRPMGPAAAAGAAAAGSVASVMDDQGRMILPGEDADFALAAQLQEEEQQRAAMRHARRSERHQQQRQADALLTSGSQPAPEQRSSQREKKLPSLGALFGKKKDKAPPSAQFQHALTPSTGGAGEAPSESLLDERVMLGTDAQGTPTSGDGRDKEKCAVM